MRQAYRAILKLYPAKYRAVFAQEMRATFEEASTDCRQRGTAALWTFALKEFAGLLRGILRERAAQYAFGSEYLASRCLVGPDAGTGAPLDAAQLENRLQQLIRSMEFAIAHHDFPRARIYSSEERVTREQLERMLGS